MIRTRLLALAVVGLGLSTARAVGNPLLYEPFDYPVTSGANNSGLTGTDGEPYATGGGGYTAPNGRAWQPTGYGTAATNNLLSVNYDRMHDAAIVSPGLSTAGLAPAGAGNAVAYGGGGYTPRLDIRGTPDAAGDISPAQGGVVYYSLAFQVTDISSLQTGGGYAAGFNNSVGQQANNPTVIAGRLNLRPDPGGSGYNIGLSKASDSTAVYNATARSLNQTQFVVVKYQFGTAGAVDDVATMWINPDPSTYGGPDPLTGTILTNTTGADIASDVIRSFLFRQGNLVATQTPSMIADELRVGTTYADVTPVPEPSGLLTAAVAAGGWLLRRRRR